jgi:hypothetical protein
LLAVTSRELIIVSAACGRLRPGRMVRTLYVPRQQIEDAGIRAGTLWLRSAGQDISVALRSRRLTAVASSLLAQVLSGGDHTCADSGSAAG